MESNVLANEFYLGIVEGEKLHRRDKSHEPEKEGNFPISGFRHRGNVFIPTQVGCDWDAKYGQSITYYMFRESMMN